MENGNGTSDSERRTYERLDRDFKISYRDLEDLSSDWLNKDGKLLDIGGGGLRFLASEKVRENSQLVMEIEFSGWQVDEDEWNPTGNSDDSGNLKVIAKVMWSVESRNEPGEFEIGVCFSGRIQ